MANHTRVYLRSARTSWRPTWLSGVRSGLPEYASHFGVSVDTVRRDLDELAAVGRLKRTHGGALRNDPLSTMEISLAERMSVQDEARIGELAATLVEDGQTILLNGGTTTLAVLRHLAPRRGLTLITNNLWAPGRVHGTAFATCTSSEGPCGSPLR